MSVKDILREMAALPPAGFPILSAYVDLSPELEAGTRPYGGGDADAYKSSPDRTAPGERGHVRPGIRRMNDLLREKEELFDIRGVERESFDADRARVMEYLEKSEFDNSSMGVVIFACHAADLWRVQELPVPVDTRLGINEVPMLYPLARLDDDYEPFALCLADGQHARIYVVAYGKAEHEETIEGKEYNRSMVGGWSQARYQRRVDNAKFDHIKEVVQRLDDLTTSEGIPYIVLSGDVQIQTEFKNQMSQQLWEKVVAVENLDIRTARDKAISRALEDVKQYEATESRSMVVKARGDALSHSLGAVGVRPVKHALMMGAVDTLLIASDSMTDDDREALTEEAFRMGSTVEFVEDSLELKKFGGVAALLRWRPADMPLPPAGVLQAAEEARQADVTPDEEEEKVKTDRP